MHNNEELSSSYGKDCEMKFEKRGLRIRKGTMLPVKREAGKEKRKGIR